MKAHVLVLILLLSGNCGFAQSLTKTEKLASLCKVWGFLKYYHPVVAEGKLDWDAELFKKIPLIENAVAKEEVNKIYIDWIKELGDIKNRESHEYATTATPKNKYLQWMNDAGLYNDELKSLLTEVKKKRTVNGGHYIKPHRFVGNANFKNEKEYKEIYPSKEVRLLSLFRYWNMIEYYFPYKYLMDKDWEIALNELIPKFYKAADALSYQVAVSEMAADVNDTHAYFFSDELVKRLHYRTFFKTKLIDDKAVIIGFFNDSLAAKNDMQYGDVITAINDTPLNHSINYWSPYISASNTPTLLRNVKNRLYAGGSDSMTLTYERAGKIYNKKVGRYPYEFYVAELKKKDESAPYKMLQDNIGYVNMGIIRPKHVKKALKALRNTNAIVFDIRNYPNGTMYAFCNGLSKEKKQFVNFTQPEYSCPGAFKYDRPYFCGKANEHAYNGKIIVLMNEETQSHAEFTCMSFKTLPNTTFIGSQTAGADGNVSDIILPGGVEFAMTGLGIYYPDGTETQRIGIVPDIEVKPTIKGI